MEQKTIVLRVNENGEPVAFLPENKTTKGTIACLKGDGVHGLSCVGYFNTLTRPADLSEPKVKDLFDKLTKQFEGAKLVIDPDFKIK